MSGYENRLKCVEEEQKFTMHIGNKISVTVNKKKSPGIHGNFEQKQPHDRYTKKFCPP